MTAAINATLFPELLTHTHVFGIGGVYTYLLIILTLLMITRDINKWKSLALIVTAGWQVAGLTPVFPEITYPILGIIFVIDNLSLQSIGNLLNTSRGLKPTEKISQFKPILSSPKNIAKRLYSDTTTIATDIANVPKNIKYNYKLGKLHKKQMEIGWIIDKTAGNNSPTIRPTVEVMPFKLKKTRPKYSEYDYRRHI